MDLDGDDPEALVRFVVGDNQEPDNETRVEQQDRKRSPSPTQEKPPAPNVPPAKLVKFPSEVVTATTKKVRQNATTDWLPVVDNCLNEVRLFMAQSADQAVLEEWVKGERTLGSLSSVVLPEVLRCAADDADSTPPEEVEDLIAALGRLLHAQTVIHFVATSAPSSTTVCWSAALEPIAAYHITRLDFHFSEASSGEAEESQDPVHFFKLASSVLQDAEFVVVRILQSFSLDAADSSTIRDSFLTSLSDAITAIFNARYVAPLLLAESGDEEYSEVRLGEATVSRHRAGRKVLHIATCFARFADELHLPSQAKFQLPCAQAFLNATFFSLWVNAEKQFALSTIAQRPEAMTARSELLASASPSPLFADSRRVVIASLRDQSSPMSQFASLPPEVRQVVPALATLMKKASTVLHHCAPLSRSADVFRLFIHSVVAETFEDICQRSHSIKNAEDFIGAQGEELIRVAKVCWEKIIHSTAADTSSSNEKADVERIQQDSIVVLERLVKGLA